MLPHWLNIEPDELSLFVFSNSIILRRERGFHLFNSANIDEHKVILKNVLSQTDVESGYLAKALAKLLNDPRWQAPKATVVLSDYFMRHAVIPWNAAIKTQQERDAYLNHHFVTIYGEELKHWDQSQSPAAYGKNTLASAVTTTLLSTIHSAFTDSAVKLDKVEPLLMHIANQAIDTIKQEEIKKVCWLVMVMDGRLNLCLIADNQWQWHKSVQVEADVVKQIDTLIHREMLVNPALSQFVTKPTELTMLLHWPEVHSSRRNGLNHFRTIKLDIPDIFIGHGLSRSASWVMP